MIEATIDMFFERKSLLAINTLAWAASDMISGIAKDKGIGTFQVAIEEWIKPEHLRDWRDLNRRSYNFTKHADRDPHAILQFYAATIPYTIFNAMAAYSEIFRQRTVTMNFYYGWFLAANPHCLKEESRGLSLPGTLQFGDLSNLTFIVQRELGAREWGSFVAVRAEVATRLSHLPVLEPEAPLISA